ncbi:MULTISPECIES: zinc-dependent metalloprotease [unclassified Pseudarthrobacter]|uniref:zinc-dependent metalloprotease n=1 Tax=unclassified Pseudarthrobacter TaxID=2647000 RepID=UPI00364379B8
MALSITGAEAHLQKTSNELARYQEGLFPLIVDAARGRVWLGIRTFGKPFLIGGGLTSGLGSSEWGLDRGRPSSVRTAVFLQRNGDVFLKYVSREFGAGSPHYPEAGASRAVEDSFAGSLVYRAPSFTVTDLPQVLLDQFDSRSRQSLAADQDTRFIDFTDFITSDVWNLAAFLAAGPVRPGAPDPTNAGFRPVPELSVVSTGSATAYPESTELEALLTFSPDNTTEVKIPSVAPDGRRISLTQHLTLLALPLGFEAKNYHPRSGAYAKGFRDLTATGPDLPDRLFQPRFRLTPAGPRDGQGLVNVETPIIFYVDPAIPEPYRSAVIEGGNWWGEAFEAAGYRDAYRVELLPENTDPWRVGVNTVWWVHRSGRGWSLGGALTDPYTGEILRGNVRLGSQRITQLQQTFEALLSPYGSPTEERSLAAIEAAIVQRIRHLAAHEIGHALGFMHNYASHAHPAPSVMDYPHPRIVIGPDGALDLGRAYSAGLGPWDIFLVRHAYADQATQAKLRAEYSGLAYLTDEDGASPEAGSPHASPWVVPFAEEAADDLAALEHVLRVRRTALAGFGPGSAPPAADNGELASRFPALHLMHRFQAAAVVRHLGGVEHAYGQLTDRTGGPKPVASASQHRALAAVLSLLDPAVLSVPDRVLAVLSPPSIRYGRGPGHLPHRLGPAFDSEAAAAAAAGVVLAELFAAARLNRLVAQHRRNRDVPELHAIVGGALAALADVKHDGDLAVTGLRYLLHGLASPDLTDGAYGTVEELLQDIAGEQPVGAYLPTPVHAAFVRAGLSRVAAGTLSGAQRYALPAIPLGIPL